MSPADKELLEKLRSIHRLAVAWGKEDSIFNLAADIIADFDRKLTEMTELATSNQGALSSAIDYMNHFMPKSPLDPGDEAEIYNIHTQLEYSKRMLP